MQPFMWSVGSIAGSALGGYTAQPAHFYPHLFSKDGLFGHYPYLLPNLVAIVVFAVAISLGAAFLEETNPNAKSQSVEEETCSLADERTPLNSQARQESIPDGPRPTFATDNVATLIDPSFDLRRSSIASIESFKPLSRVVSTVEAVEEADSLLPESSDPPATKAFNASVVMWTIALVLMSYHQMAFVSILPIYALDDPWRTGLDLFGGLGLTIHDVGSFMAVNSVVSLFSQVVIFPAYVGRVGVWKSILSMSYFCPLVQIAVPFVTLLPDPAVGIYISMALQSLSTIIIYPSLLIMLKNATSPMFLGKVNGLAMSACSVARTVSPPLVGIFYSTFGSSGAWWSCAVFAIAAAVQLYFIPRTKEEAAIFRTIEVSVEDALADEAAVEGENQCLR